MDEFKAKVAVIIGAASGIGFALARQACQEGWCWAGPLFLLVSPKPDG